MIEVMNLKKIEITKIKKKETNEKYNS